MYLVSFGIVGLCAKNREQDFFVDMTGVEAQEIRALLRKVDPYMLAYYFVEFQRGRFIGGKYAISFAKIKKIVQRIPKQIASIKKTAHIMLAELDAKPAARRAAH
jgi:hypothetical protein